MCFDALSRKDFIYIAEIKPFFPTKSMHVGMYVCMYVRTCLGMHCITNYDTFCVVFVALELDYVGDSKYFVCICLLSLNYSTDGSRILECLTIQRFIKLDQQPPNGNRMRITYEYLTLSRSWVCCHAYDFARKVIPHVSLASLRLRLLRRS
jgi:hypothetical protein